MTIMNWDKNIEIVNNINNIINILITSLINYLEIYLEYILITKIILILALLLIQINSLKKQYIVLLLIISIIVLEIVVKYLNIFLLTNSFIIMYYIFTKIWNLYGFGAWEQEYRLKNPLKINKYIILNYIKRVIKIKINLTKLILQKVQEKKISKRNFLLLVVIIISLIIITRLLRSNIITEILNVINIKLLLTFFIPIVIQQILNLILDLVKQDFIIESLILMMKKAGQAIRKGWDYCLKTGAKIRMAPGQPIPRDGTPEDKIKIFPGVEVPRYVKLYDDIKRELTIYPRTQLNRYIKTEDNKVLEYIPAALDFIYMKKVQKMTEIEELYKFVYKNQHILKREYEKIRGPAFKYDLGAQEIKNKFEDIVYKEIMQHHKVDQYNVAKLYKDPEENARGTAVYYFLNEIRGAALLRDVYENAIVLNLPTECKAGEPDMLLFIFEDKLKNLKEIKHIQQKSTTSYDNFKKYVKDFFEDKKYASTDILIVEMVDIALFVEKNIKTNELLNSYTYRNDAENINQRVEKALTPQGTRQEENQKIYNDITIELDLYRRKDYTNGNGAIIEENLLAKLRKWIKPPWIEQFKECFKEVKGAISEEEGLVDESPCIKPSEIKEIERLKKQGIIEKEVLVDTSPCIKPSEIRERERVKKELQKQEEEDNTNGVD